MAPLSPLAPAEPSSASLPAPGARRTQCSPIAFMLSIPILFMLSVPILFMLSPSSSPSASPKPRHGGSALFPSPGGTAWADAMWRLVQTLGLQGRFGRPQLCSGNPSSAGAGSSCSPSSTSWLAATHSLGLALPLGRVPSAETSPLGLMPVSVSHKLLKAGRSLDAGPNGGQMGARRMPWGGCPPRLASSSGTAHGKPQHRVGDASSAPWPP